jgi:hypothetical protein
VTQTHPALVDYSYGRPGGATIAGAGYLGAMRYLGNDGRCIFSSEVADLHAHGVGIGLIWETTADRTLDGYHAGVEDAGRADGEADELGAPVVPIFYCVDFAPDPGQLYGVISDYFAGARASTRRPVGAYGCASVMQAIVGDNKLAEVGWQCAAWSYPGTAPGTPINDGGWDLILSPYASMLQTIGYVLGDTSDHNNLLTGPPTWLWTPDGGTWEDDDMNTEEARLELTGQTTEPVHQVYARWFGSDNRRYHVLLIHDVAEGRAAQWWLVFGIFKTRLADDYAGWARQRPDVLDLGDQRGGSWALAAADTAVEVSAEILQGMLDDGTT